MTCLFMLVLHNFFVSLFFDPMTFVAFNEPGSGQYVPIGNWYWPKWCQLSVVHTMYINCKLPWSKQTNTNRHKVTNTPILLLCQLLWPRVLGALDIYIKSLFLPNLTLIITLPALDKCAHAGGFNWQAGSVYCIYRASASAHLKGIPACFFQTSFTFLWSDTKEICIWNLA